MAFNTRGDLISGAGTGDNMRECCEEQLTGDRSIITEFEKLNDEHGTTANGWEMIGRKLFFNSNGKEHC
jgi:hypothetical protein